MRARRYPLPSQPRSLARDLRRRRLQQIIDDYEREHGAIDEREMRRIRAQWKD